MTPTARPFHLSDASIRVDSMPTAGRDLTLRVDADERATLASELDVSAVNALEVKLQAVRFRHSENTVDKMEAQLRKAVAARKPKVHQTAGSTSRIELGVASAACCQLPRMARASATRSADTSKLPAGL